jgi:NRPS condensation-like uncharacterized protein
VTHSGPAAHGSSLQTRLEHDGTSEGHVAARDSAPPISDPVGLLRHLEASGRFHRDTGLGRIFHPGSVSFRESVATNSLHVLIHSDRISAHVDRVSPLGLRPPRLSRYSLRRATVHNVAAGAQDLLRLLRGRQGDHRSELGCEWLWDGWSSDLSPDDLLHPAGSAWSVQLEARVSGTLDYGRLQAAVATVLGQRPMNHGVVDVADCPDDSSLDATRSELHRTPVKVTAWPPLRARLARHPGGDVLMLSLNHAASDGRGALTVLRAIADAYAGSADGHPALDFLAAYDLPVRPASAPVSALQARFRAGVERLRDALARPARLAPHQPPDDPWSGFHHVRLSVEDTRSVVIGERPGTSRNMLLAALHLAVGEWNLQHGTPGRQVGVLVPVDLRPDEWPDEVVGNFSVTARVSTRRRDRADAAAALKAVAAQTTRNKRSRTGIALIAGLARSGLLPLWAKQSLVVLQPLTGNRLVDTALLTNLGQVDEPPSFGPEAGETTEVWFSAPSRAPLSLCVGAVTLSGRLHLVLRYPRRLFGADAARRFADCYLAQIRSVAKSRMPAGSDRQPA